MILYGPAGKIMRSIMPQTKLATATGDTLERSEKPSRAGDRSNEPKLTGPALATRLFSTRKVEVEVCEAINDLRINDPKTAARFDAAMTQMPVVGDDFMGFKLIHELGRGAFGHVFLARQTGLADRLVALKLAANLHGESQRLAQLQHTNIVPIYSEHRSGDLHGVCMPYFGSTTLADVCRELRPNTSLPHSGKHIVSTLCNRQSTVRGLDASSASGQTSSGAEPASEHAIAAPPRSLNSASGTLSKIEEMSYVEAVLWLTSRLADGLVHAHERGIIHRDLKPANVLICDDGQPMLLDFNLADEVRPRSSSAAVAHVGGTLPYMSPEQLMAYRDGEGRVDARGDIYGLGLIVFHLLTGQHAFPLRRGPSRVILPKMIEDRQGTAPLLRTLNRAVSPAIESIVQKCLQADPANRYVSASKLAEDIERHRANLPLRYAANPSFAERMGKWAKRNPRLASPLACSFLAAALLLVAISLSVHFSLKAKSRNLELHRQQALSHYHDFESDYRETQDLLMGNDASQVAIGLQTGEKALRGYGVLDQADWLEQPELQQLSPADRYKLKVEVGEIAFLLAQAFTSSRRKTM